MRRTRVFQLTPNAPGAESPPGYPGPDTRFEVASNGASWRDRCDRPATMLGTTIAHYRVIDRLGAGGMGEVFLADDLRLHRRVALKLVSPGLTSDEARRQRLLQEARLAASIDHPHIAAIHDIGEAGDRTYIAMEYVEGRPLRGLLAEGAPARAGIT